MSLQYRDKTARELRQEERELLHIRRTGRLLHAELPIHLDPQAIATRLRDVREGLALRRVR